jgi:purine-binding chemotaxis protein CheW
MVLGKNGYSFNQIIKEAIVFFFFFIINENALPELDIILVRDVLSYLPANEQTRIIAGFSDRLKNRGVVIMGRNEELFGTDWYSIADDPISAYLHDV